LKKNKYTAFCAWVLLICFVAGQYMVYAHQHNILKKAGITFNVSKNQPRPAITVQEKCYMCDAMHHNAMEITHAVYYSPVVVTSHVYKTGDYNFISIALVLSAGRAPPVTAISC
jgi:hypothetical protein